MSLLASKSNAKAMWISSDRECALMRHHSHRSSVSCLQKLTQLAQLPVGPWAVDIYDEDLASRSFQ